MLLIFVRVLIFFLFIFFFFVQICGEHNIGRYLARLIESISPSNKIYESLSSPDLATEVDEHMEQCHTKLVLGTNR